jgi:hypothetical protein
MLYGSPMTISVACCSSASRAALDREAATLILEAELAARGGLARAGEA